MSGSCRREIGQALDRAERALVHRNEELGELNEELTAVEEELRQNVDELTKKEKELRESEERLTHHIDNSPLAVIGFDASVPDYRSGQMRPAGCSAGRGRRSWGRRSATSPGYTKRTQTGSPPSLRYAEREELPRNLHENRNYRKDGSVIECEWYNSALRDADGNLISIQSQVLDVTGRNRTARALEESERFLRETEKIAKLGGWKANPHTDYLQWTEGIYAIIEAPRDYRPGLTEGMKYFSPEDRPLIRERIETCLSTGEPFTLEVLITTGTGKMVWTELRGLSPVTEGDRCLCHRHVPGYYRAQADRRETEKRERQTGHPGRICPAALEF